MIGALATFLGFLSYAFVILAIFRLFKINYFNPIVKIFTTYLEPVPRSVLFFLSPLMAALVLALVLKFISFYLASSSGNEALTLFYLSIIDVLKFGFLILFYSLMGSVILSWVAPGNNHPLLQIVEEIGSNIMGPIRKFMPPMGGLDFTPIIGLLVLNKIYIELSQIFTSML
jgi:YggT family protein